ncbi:mobile mystery protein B [Candidatus Saganbacteria bacterium]|nr:mobile mystery protein B [Candidatus Saganbacteria bacterium]
MRTSSDLIPSHITTRSELNEWEAANILKAVKFYLTEKRTFDIDIAWLKKLHEEMFDETWKWAGKFRQINYNLGIDWHNINEQMKALADDIAYWKAGTSNLNVFEQSVRIHHRLVKIHPFVNGNGRQARLASDIFLFNNDFKLPNWPSEALLEASNIRKTYVAALQEADKGNYKPLETFTADLIS